MAAAREKEPTTSSPVRPTATHELGVASGRLTGQYGRLDQADLTPAAVRDARFGYERDGYDVELVDGLLEDIANVLEEGASAADLVPTDPASQLPTRRKGYRRDQVTDLLGRVRLLGPVPQHSIGPTVLTSHKLVIRGPAILGPDGTRLGRIEHFEGGSKVVYDAARRVVLEAHRGRRFSRAWIVNEPAGRTIGRVVVRIEVISNELRRATLYSGDELVGGVRVQRPSLTVRVRHWTDPPPRHYLVSDPSGNEMARITSSTSRGTRITLDVLQALPEPVRRLLVFLAAVPAQPVPHQPGMTPPQV